MKKSISRSISFILIVCMSITTLLQPANSLDVYAAEIEENVIDNTDEKAEENYIIEDNETQEADKEIQPSEELSLNGSEDSQSKQEPADDSGLNQTEGELLEGASLEKISLEACDITVSLDENNTPVVVVKYQGESLAEGQDYTCSLPSADKDDYYPIVEGKTDKAYIAVTGKGSYTGIVTVSCDLPITALYSIYIDSVSLSLLGNVRFKTYIDVSSISQLRREKTIYIVLDGEKIRLNDLTFVDVDFAVVEKKVLAKNLHEPISLTAYIEGENGEPDQQLRIRSGETSLEYEHDEFKISVYDYISRVINNTQVSQYFKQLMRDLENYGDYSGFYFGIDDLESDITYIDNSTKLALKKYEKIEEGTLPNGIEYVGSSLILDSNVVIRHYFKADDEDVLWDYSFGVDKGDYVQIIDLNSCEGGMYYVEIRDIPAAELGKSFDLKILSYDGDVWTLKYSVLSYLYDVAKKDRQDSLNALGNAIYSYYKSSATYYGVIEDMSDYTRPEETVTPKESEFSSVSGNTTPGRTVTGNKVTGMTEGSLLNLAKTMIDDYSDDTNFEKENNKWKYFTDAARASGIDYNHPLTAYNYESGKSIGIYGGYKSDDIYIYYGDMTPEGIRQGKDSVWLGEHTSDYIELDTGLVRYIASREKTVCDWVNDVPQGSFSSDFYFNILTGTGENIDVERHYSGNLTNGYYDGDIIWNTTAEYADSGEEALLTYSAYFNHGYVVYDVIDSEGYTYITCDNEKALEKIYTKKAYGISGFGNIYTVSGNYIVDSENRYEYAAPGIEIGNMYKYVSENGNGVSGNSVSGESISYNHVYDTVSTNRVTKQYAEILGTLAERVIAGGTDFNIDDWNSMVEIANATGISKSDPFKVMLDDGTYAAIYVGTDENIYLYHGSMSNWMRSGKGSWITAKDIDTLYSDGKRAYGKYISVTEGRWINDIPNGEFVSTQVTYVDKDAYSATISRKYSGNAVSGAYNGEVNWRVDSLINYRKACETVNTSHKYAAKFDNGVITGLNIDKEGYVYVPETNTGYSEDKLYYYKQYGYPGVATKPAFKDNVLIEYPVSGNVGPVISGNHVSNNRAVKETSTQEFDSIKQHYVVSGNTVSSNVGQSILSSVTGNHYETDELVDMAYTLVTSSEIDTDLLNTFNEECIKGGITYTNPLMAQYNDGYYIGIYGGYKDSDTIYIYYGGTNNFSRQGKGIWFTAKAYDVVNDGKVYKCTSIDKTDAVWKDNIPQGRFNEKLTVTCQGPDKDIRNVRTYSGYAKDGLYNKNISWTVESDSVVDGVNYKNSSDYSANFTLGFIDYEYRDSEGYTLIESSDGGYHLDRVNTRVQFRIAGRNYDEWTDVYSATMVASQNRAEHSTSENAVLPKSTYTINGDADPADTSVSHNSVRLEAQNSEMFSISGNTTAGGNSSYRGNYETSDEMLLDYAYELVMAEDIDYYKWREFNGVISDKGLNSTKTPLQGIRNDGTGVAIYYDAQYMQSYIYVGEMYNWKRSGNGTWMTVYGGLDKINPDGTWNSYYAVSDKTVCKWKNDSPNGDFTQTVSTVLKKGDIVSKSEKKYSGNINNGAYDGAITWTETNSYQNGADIIDSAHTFVADFVLGKVTGYLSDNQGNVYIPSTNGGYAECCLSANKMYTLPLTSFSHTISGNTMVETVLNEDADKEAGIEAPIIGKVQDVHANLGDNITISTQVKNSQPNTVYFLMKHVVNNRSWPRVNRWVIVANSNTPSLSFVASEEFEYMIRAYNVDSDRVYDSSTANIIIDDDMGEIVRKAYSYSDVYSKAHIYLEHTGYMRNPEIELLQYHSFSDGTRYIWSNTSYIMESKTSTYSDGVVTEEWVSSNYNFLNTMCDIRIRYQDKAGNYLYTDTYRLNTPNTYSIASGDISADEASRVEWSLSYDKNKNLILNILGYGNIKDFASSVEQPWRSSVPYGRDIYAIIIDDRITGIGSYNFADCGSVYVGTSDIFECGITDVNTAYRCLTDSSGQSYMPRSLQRIGAYAFSETRFRGGYVTFGSKLIDVKDKAFWNSGLNTIILHSCETTIDKNSFFSNSNTMGVYCYKGSSVYQSISNSNYLNRYSLSVEPELSSYFSTSNDNDLNCEYKYSPLGYYELSLYKPNISISIDATWTQYDEWVGWYDNLYWEISENGENWGCITDDIIPSSAYYITDTDVNSSINKYTYGNNCEQRFVITDPEAFKGYYIRARYDYSKTGQSEEPVPDYTQTYRLSCNY